MKYITNSYIKVFNPAKMKMIDSDTFSLSLSLNLFKISKTGVSNINNDTTFCKDDKNQQQLAI